MMNSVELGKGHDTGGAGEARTRDAGIMLLTLNCTQIAPKSSVALRCTPLYILCKSLILIKAGGFERLIQA